MIGQKAVKFTLAETSKRKIHSRAKNQLQSITEYWCLWCFFNNRNPCLEVIRNGLKQKVSSRGIEI